MNTLVSSLKWFRTGTLRAVNDCHCVLWHFLPWFAHYELGFIFGLCRCLISLHFFWSFVLNVGHSIFLLVHLPPVILPFLISKSHFPNQCVSCLDHEIRYSQETSGIFSFVLSVGWQRLLVFLPKCTVIEWETKRKSVKLCACFLFCKEYLLWCFFKGFFFQFRNIQRRIHPAQHASQACRSSVCAYWRAHWFFKSTLSNRKFILTSNLELFLLQLLSL